MRRCLLALSVAFTLFVPLRQADAGVTVTIDKWAQRMVVSVDGAPLHSWAVSTGRRGYGTPNGVYRPQRLARKWFSRKYYNSPMPHSIFFHGGFAIHGSYEIARLGGPASHGCVRLHPDNAATLFSIVQAYGMDSTRIVVSGEIPTAIARPAPSAPRPAPQYVPRPYYGYAPLAPQGNPWFTAPRPYYFDHARRRWENRT